MFSFSLFLGAPLKGTLQGMDDGKGPWGGGGRSENGILALLTQHSNSVLTIFLLTTYCNLQ